MFAARVFYAVTSIKKSHCAAMANPVGLIDRNKTFFYTFTKKYSDYENIQISIDSYDVSLSWRHRICTAE